MDTLRFEQRVEGKEEKPFEKNGDILLDKDKLSSEMEQYRAEAQTFIDSYERFFQTFAKDISLKMKLGSAFFIDLENGEVNEDIRWYANRGFTKVQILWAKLHELSHFRDLADDPDRMMRNFDHIQIMARVTGTAMMRKWEVAFGTSDPELIERLKKQMPFSKKKASPNNERC